jgi:hypothetical protein
MISAALGPARERRVSSSLGSVAERAPIPTGCAAAGTAARVLRSATSRAAQIHRIGTDDPRRIRSTPGEE